MANTSHADAMAAGNMAIVRLIKNTYDIAQELPWQEGSERERG